MDDGFFNLKTAEDLFEKLEADFESLKSTPGDTYIAFNFFVTAYHLHEWADWKKEKGRKHLILKICEHLAVGAKHFRVTDSNIKSVERTERNGWVEAGWVEPGWVKETLVVTLADDEASEFGEKSVDVLTLAQEVMVFWGDRFEKQTKKRPG